VPEISKLSVVLDDPEIRVLIFALSHARSTHPSAEPGMARLRAIVLHLADTTDLEQYRSWLSDDAPNMRMTVDQVRMTVGERAINDLASFVGGSPSAVTWQLAAVLPDLVDAVSPGGEVIDVNQLSRELEDASAYDDSSAGAFGSHLY
jgi:xanthosine utilization system XapX-like protein